MDLLTWVIENKDERIDIAGYGNYSIAAVAGLILEGKANWLDTSLTPTPLYGYLTDCLREKMESET